jgi:hypothetical protein
MPIGGRPAPSPVWADHLCSDRNIKRLALPILLLAVSSVPAQEPSKTAAKARPRPTLQYDSGEIRIPLPNADDPKVREFGPESIRAAAKYLYRGNFNFITYIATAKAMKAPGMCGELDRK